MSGADAAIEAVDLTKSYGRARGIEAVTMTAAPGEVVGLIGANGAGKTTFMRVLLDFIRPTSGAVRVFGLDSRADSVEVRRRTTYLPGELVLPPRLTGHEVLKRYAFTRQHEDLQRAPQVAERLGLDLDRKVGDLSKGNKQKVGLVLAFAPTAALLVLDEPTSGLDPLLQREFAAMVREKVADGATVLLSSHVMSEVEHITTSVALVRDGRLAAHEQIGAILARSRRRGTVRPEVATDAEPLAAALRETPRVSEVAVADGVVTFAVDGSIDGVLKTLGRFTVVSLDLAHADLEDAFFAAYDGSQDDGEGA